MTTIHHSPPPDAPPFAIYEDSEDQEPPSPSDVYEHDMSFHSESSFPTADEPIPSIEEQDGNLDEGPQPYSSSYTSRPSSFVALSNRRASGVTTTSMISSLPPSEFSMPAKPVQAISNGADMRYTPRKERPTFRNPSSVRAMQMSSPPPFTSYEDPRERLKGQYKLATPSRSGRSETPVSASGSRRSGSHRTSHRESQVHATQSPRPTATPQQLPLVLLHVTILPLQVPYPHELMMKVMPGWLVENYRLLEEKLKDIVLMRRGLLIPHPREEYDVLEERILESLELKTPRLLKCGHFFGARDESEEHDYYDDTKSVTDDGTGRGSRMSGGTMTNEEDGEWKYPTPDIDDASVCTDCHRQVKKPGKGIGVGTKRWDIKVFAANGLMRAGAWSAVWTEMERCDVDISPWIPEDVRKAIERKVDEEQQAEKQRLLQEEEIHRRVEEEAARNKKIEEELEERKKLEEAEVQRRIEEESAKRALRDEAEQKRLFEEALNNKIDEAKETIRLEVESQALAESSFAAERFRLLEDELTALKEERLTSSAPPPAVADPPVVAPPSNDEHLREQSRRRHHSRSRHPQQGEVPLGTLLRNYILLQVRDQKNLVIFLLSLAVAYLATQMNTATATDISSIAKFPDDTLALASPPVVTTTATTTVTQIQSGIDSNSATLLASPVVDLPASSSTLAEATSIPTARSSVPKADNGPTGAASEVWSETRPVFEPAYASLNPASDIPHASDSISSSSSSVLQDTPGVSTPVLSFSPLPPSSSSLQKSATSVWTPNPALVFSQIPNSDPTSAA